MSRPVNAGKYRGSEEYAIVAELTQVGSGRELGGTTKRRRTEIGVEHCDSTYLGCVGAHGVGSAAVGSIRSKALECE